MPCLIVILALMLPRVTLVLLWLANRHYLQHAYHTALWPILGFFFMPLTTLAYAWAINSAGSVTGVYFLVVLLAALVDVGTVGGGRRARRWRRRRRRSGYTSC